MPRQHRNAVAPTAPGEYHLVRNGPTVPEASPQLDPQQQLDPECDDREFNDTVDELEDASKYSPALSAGIGGRSRSSSARRPKHGKRQAASGDKEDCGGDRIGTIITAIRLTLRMSEGYQEVILTMVGLAFLVIVDGLDYRDKKRVLEKKHHMESVWEHVWFSTVLALVVAVVIGGFSWLIIYTLR